MRALSQMLSHTEQTLVQAEERDSAADSKLDSVTSDAQKLERTVQELLDQVEFIKNSDIRGKKAGSKHRVQKSEVRGRSLKTKTKCLITHEKRSHLTYTCHDEAKSVPRWT